MTTLDFLLLALVAVLLGVELVTVALCLWRYRSTEVSAPVSQPKFTLLRPVCGLDRFDAETLESSFLLDYPDYEVIFCAAQQEDPAVAVLRGLVAKYPHVPAQILIGDDRITGNPKLNNLEKGVQRAVGEWLAMADANLLLPADYFTRILEVVQADTGLVTSPPIGTRAENLWGAVEAAFLNSFQARWQISADMLGNGFAQGKTLCWRRDVLAAAGGLVALGQDLAEDVASTKAVRAQGLKVRLVRHPFTQPVGRRSFRAVWDRQLRWARVRRDGFLAIFAAEILLGPWLPALLVLGMGQGALVPVLWGLWYLAEWGLARVAGWPHGPRDVAAMVLRDILMPALWAVTWTRRGFEWRGSAMDRGGSLTPPKAVK
ncbi:ceramide glucosyltransferase [Thioclava sp. GXIMD4215]|uniref:ceramide glucosyltransferase n=1 Tax=Thioclava sp. GXIMD4215 TaxID=3131928 RepID=UPI003253A31F